MKLEVNLDEKEIKQAVREYLTRQSMEVVGEVKLNVTQNYDRHDRPSGHRVAVKCEVERTIPEG